MSQHKLDLKRARDARRIVNPATKRVRRVYWDKNGLWCKKLINYQ